jgi:hypothetical protein
MRSFLMLWMLLVPSLAHAYDADTTDDSGQVAPPSTVAPQPKEPPRAAPSRGTPPLSAGRLLGELMIGGLAGIGGAYVGGYIGYATCTDHSGEWACVGNVVIGGYLGGIVAMSAGVYAVGSLDDQAGSYGSTLGGALLGSLVGIGIAAAGEDEGAAIVGLIAMPIGGAIIGFNASRHYDKVNVAVTPTAGGAALMLSTAW